MTDFSVDLAAEQIVDRRSREHFQEVLSSYTVNNLRSAAVMLWTVVVCDLVYKLQELRDAEGDQAAKAILADVAAQQQQNPTSPAWEADLLEQVRKRTMLLDAAEYTQLAHLQKVRHLSAHPVLGAADLLYRPNRETMRAAIRNAMEAVLLKPAVFSKGAVDALLEDLESRRDALPDHGSLRRYLEARFVPAGTPAAVEDAMFQRLWTVAFKAADSRAAANRTINVRALRVLHERRPAETRAHVQANAAAYSRVGTGARLQALSRFLGLHPLLFAPLTAAAKEPLTQLAASEVNERAYAWYLSQTPAAHVDALANALASALAEGHRDAVARKERSPDLRDKTWRRLLDAATAAGLRPQALRVGVDQYVRSRSFDEADRRFAQYVAPHVEEYDAAVVRALLDGIEANGETRNRWRAGAEHLRVLNAGRRVLGAAFDDAQYPQFLADFTERE